jgi:hypothetical protein
MRQTPWSPSASVRFLDTTTLRISGCKPVLLAIFTIGGRHRYFALENAQS